MKTEFAPARKTMGEPLFTAAWEEGAAMTMEQTIAYALEASGKTVNGLEI